MSTIDADHIGRHLPIYKGETEEFCTVEEISAAQGYSNGIRLVNRVVVNCLERHWEALPWSTPAGSWRICGG
jgi:hypothetical protein